MNDHIKESDMRRSIIDELPRFEDMDDNEIAKDNGIIVEKIIVAKIIVGKK